MQKGDQGGKGYELERLGRILVERTHKGIATRKGGKEEQDIGSGTAMNKSSILISISVSAAMNAPKGSHALRAGRSYTYQMWDFVSLEDLLDARRIATP